MSRKAINELLEDITKDPGEWQGVQKGSKPHEPSLDDIDPCCLNGRTMPAGVAQAEDGDLAASRLESPGQRRHLALRPPPL